MSDKNILLIEDNKTLAMGLEACLNTLDYRVQLAVGGQDALILCQQNMPDLVITDVRMPQGDGPTFLRQLRSLSAGKNIPVIVISGVTASTAIDDMKALGVSGVLIKPFNLNTLLNPVSDNL